MNPFPFIITQTRSVLFKIYKFLFVSIFCKYFPLYCLRQQILLPARVKRVRVFICITRCIIANFYVIKRPVEATTTAIHSYRYCISQYLFTIVKVYQICNAFYTLTPQYYELFRPQHRGQHTMY